MARSPAPSVLPDVSDFDPALVAQDLHSRIAAAREANARYRATRDHLAARVAALSQGAASVIRLLEARHSELSAARERWAESLAAIPAAAQLEATLFGLRSRVVAQTASEPPASRLLDAAPFIAMGVLPQGESLAVLPLRIDALLAVRARVPRGDARSLERLRREAHFLRSMGRFETLTRSEIEGFQSELSQRRKDMFGG
jgi:hypothetical protein